MKMRNKIERFARSNNLCYSIYVNPASYYENFNVHYGNYIMTVGNPINNYVYAIFDADLCVHKYFENLPELFKAFKKLLKGGSK